jgi:hypothetical protein
VTEGLALPERVDLRDQHNLQRWIDHFGVTEQQLAEAEKAVGDDPNAIQEHLMRQGASAGPG